MDFRQELRALIDRHLDPVSIYSHFFIIEALRVERKRLDLETDKFPEHAEDDEEKTIDPARLKAYHERVVIDVDD